MRIPTRGHYGRVDITDAMLIAQHSAGMPVPGIVTGNADTNCDAVVSVLAALDYLTQRSTVRDRVDPNRLMVMGHSAGGAGSFIAVLQRSTLKTVVGLAPGAPGNLLNMANLRMPIMIIGGQNDGTITPSYLNGIWTTIVEKVVNRTSPGIVPERIGNGNRSRDNEDCFFYAAFFAYKYF